MEVIPDELILTEKDLCDKSTLSRGVLNFYTIREYAIIRADYDLLFLLDELEDFIRYSPKISKPVRKYLIYRMNGYSPAETSRLLGKTNGVSNEGLERGYKRIIKYFGGDTRQ